MILLDEREGSKRLAEYYPLEGHHQLSRLDFDIDNSGKPVPCGDAMLTGHGPGGSTISIGVEIKSIHDLLSSIATGRLSATQLPRLLRAYDYAYLATFGQYRPGPAGVLQVRGSKGIWRTYRIGKRSVPYGYLLGWLTTATMLTSLRWVHFYDDFEVACWLRCMDHWLEKPWESHRALQVFDKSRQASPLPEADPVENQIAKVAAAFPAIDFVKGWKIARHFESVEEFMDASLKDLMEVDGIGPVIAKSTYQMIRRRK